MNLKRATQALNRQLRKATKTKGSFPSEEAAIKLLCAGVSPAPTLIILGTSTG